MNDRETVINGRGREKLEMQGRTGGLGSRYRKAHREKGRKGLQGLPYRASL